MKTVFSIISQSDREKKILYSIYISANITLNTLKCYKKYQDLIYNFFFYPHNLFTYPISTNKIVLIFLKELLCNIVHQIKSTAVTYDCSAEAQQKS